MLSEWEGADPPTDRRSHASTLELRALSQRAVSVRVHAGRRF